MDQKTLTRNYSNGTITVVWKPGLCIHSTICWKGETGLSEVFNPKERPWINIGGAATERIVDQVKKCPSGALSFFYNEHPSTETEQSTDTRVEVLHNGPLLVFGTISVKDQRGDKMKKTKVTAFCRCGLSGNKPYCDGSHQQTRLDD
ncbi:MAG TPA: (4Fe-4S)-binding protein [Flavisolibacter sp.]|nr:(4Fe-4S)-binding protein [Flavisolibacter sp.]